MTVLPPPPKPKKQRLTQPPTDQNGHGRTASGQDVSGGVRKAPMRERAQSAIPAYVSRQRAAYELDMSPDTFDEYVAKGILPAPIRRGKLTRWKWSEIVSALEGGNASLVPSVGDDYERGVDRAKAAHA